jgi:tetratricopeptide (TPR) repeat protein
MVRIFWLAVGFVVLLVVLLLLGLLSGQVEMIASRIVGGACSLACPLMFFMIFWAPGLFRETTAGISQFFARIGARRREIEDLQRKIAHLDKAHHMALLGNVYRREGRRRQAIEWFRKAMEKDPDLLDARYKLGLCYYDQRDFAAAAELLVGVCQEKPQHDYGLADLRLAQSLHGLGRNDGAEEAYQTLLRFYPGHPEGSFCFAQLKEELGDRAAARGLMQEVVFAVRHSPGFQRRRNRHWLIKAQLWLWRN